MGFLEKLIRVNKSEQKTVGAMLGICVHDPDILLEPPSNVRRIAAGSLSRGLDGASLSPDAKTAYLIARGTLSIEESERQARNDLPEQIKGWMRQQGLTPEDYDFEYFDEDLRTDVKVLWGVAVSRSG